MVKALVGLITLYQHTLSPDYGWFKARYPGGYCRFHPSCSDYSKQALLSHGLMKGIFLTVARLSRCHPWTASGFDPVPHNSLER